MKATRMKRLTVIAALAAVCSAGAADLVFHMDFNTIQMRRGLVSKLLKEVAASRYTHVLWEIEDKVRFDTCPEAAHREAFSKEEFKKILAEAKALGLKNIPLLQTFGHAEYILRLEKYRHLREIDSSTDCYCVSKSGTRELLKKLIAEYIDLFGGGEMDYFHLGGDECYDFCKCPVCSKRNAMELYAEHLNAIAGPIRELGIRPCIWNDMLVKPQWEKDIDAIPKDFVIYHWDYYHGNRNNPIKWRDKLQYLIDHGFTCVFAAASGCGGDDPFLPGLEFHRRNIDAGWAEVEKHKLVALCVTSWSVRQNSKELQLPLIRYAGTRVWELGPEYDDLTKWKPDLCGLDGRGWHRYKDATVPPPGQFEKVQRRIDETKNDIWGRPLQPGAETYRQRLINALSDIRKRLVDALPKVSGRWKDAGGLKLRMIDAILANLRGETYAEIPFEDTVSYFGAEQTPLSARNSAEIVWGYYRESENQSPRFQKVVDDAKAAGKGEVVWKEDAVFFAPVRIPSNMRIVLDGCTLTAAPGLWTGFFVADDVENIAIVGRNGATLDGNRPNGLTESTSMKNGYPYVRVNSPVLMTNVKDIRISGLTVRNSNYWGLTFHYCSDAVIEDIVFDAAHDRANQDGIDLRNGCRDFKIRNISGQTGDDMVALSAIDWKKCPYYREDLCQDICNVEITDVVGAAQNHPLVAMRNSNGAKLYNVTAKRIRHTPFMKPCKGAEVPRYALVRIGNNMYFSERPSEAGETYDITLEDLDTGYALRGVVLASAVDNLTIRNVTGWGVCRTLVTTDGPKWAGPLGVKARNVTVENAVLKTDMPDARVIDFSKQREGDYVENLVEKNVTLEPSAAPAPEKKAGWAPKTVTIPSTRDGSWQSFHMWFPENAEGKVPLLVALHTWSYDFNAKSPGEDLLDECKKRGWAFVYPNFRGPNSTSEACGSEFAVQDILDAVAWMKVYNEIDAARVYVVGSSGGGHMTLLLSGLVGPRIFAAAAAFCPISDLRRWHADSMLRGGHYARMMEKACGGTPKEKPVEYAARSPLTYLKEDPYFPVMIATGIHDGHTGSVPVGHAIRAYNSLASENDRISERDIAYIEENERVPEHLRFKGSDPFYSKKNFIHLRRTSGNVQLTIFEGGHSGNLPAALDFFRRQRWWTPADWSLPVAAQATDVSSVTK